MAFRGCSRNDLPYSASVSVVVAHEGGKELVAVRLQFLSDQGLLNNDTEAYSQGARLGMNGDGSVLLALASAHAENHTS